MTYVALEWDHKIGKFAIGWLVVKCASVGQKFGGPQALPPRKDIAYFVNPETAEMDAKSFAEFKNKSDAADQEEFVKINLAEASRHAAFEWDHNIFNPLIKWAVLEWGAITNRLAHETMWHIFWMENLPKWMQSHLVL